MHDKTFLITGATSGIGKATAEAAAEDGYRLILTGRREDALNDLVSAIGADRCVAVSADATSLSDQARVVQAGIEAFGDLHAVFANAGTGASTPGTETGDPAEWESMIGINVMGLLYTAKLTLPHLRKTKGHFVVTASAAGRRWLKGSVYGATKWFAYGLGQNLAMEMAEWGGRCTTICPGMVDTPFFDEPKPDKLKPEDVADAVLYALRADARNTVREVFLMPSY
ncbi:MAG: SDR family oxidoreductase [Pseudomonadota bacterium]